MTGAGSPGRGRSFRGGGGVGAGGLSSLPDQRPGCGQFVWRIGRFIKSALQLIPGALLRIMGYFDFMPSAFSVKLRVGMDQPRRTGHRSLDVQLP